MKQRCGDCRFYKREPQVEECHRYPPRVEADQFTREIARILESAEWENIQNERWPYVDENDWCGEWKPKGDDDAA